MDRDCMRRRPDLRDTSQNRLPSASAVGAAPQIAVPRRYIDIAANQRVDDEKPAFVARPGVGPIGRAVRLNDPLVLRCAPEQEGIGLAYADAVELSGNKPTAAQCPTCAVIDRAKHASVA